MLSLNLSLAPFHLGRHRQTLREHTREQLRQKLEGKEDPDLNWVWTDGNSVNPQCWAYGWELSGFSVSETTGQTITLITPKHGITCAHSPPEVGATATFIGNDGNPVVGTIASFESVTVSGASSPVLDLLLVTFQEEFPATVVPFPVLPTDYATRGELAQKSGDKVAGAEALFYRANSMKMNVKLVCVWLLGSGFPSLNPAGRTWQMPPDFTEPTVTAGDSGSPAWLVINGRPVFIFSTWLNDPNGPLPSFPGRLQRLQELVAPYTLETVSLADFPITL